MGVLAIPSALYMYLVAWQAQARKAGGELLLPLCCGFVGRNTAYKYCWAGRATSTSTAQNTEDSPPAGNNKQLPQLAVQGLFQKWM